MNNNFKIVLENLLSKRQFHLNRNWLTINMFTFQDTSKSDHEKIQILKALPEVAFLCVLNNLLFWHNIYAYPDHPDYQALKQSTYLNEFRLLLKTDRKISSIKLPNSFIKIKEEYELAKLVFHRVGLIYDTRKMIIDYL